MRSLKIELPTFDHTQLGHLLASLGILGVAIVSAIMSFCFWETRSDHAAAWLTLGAECVAAGGFVMVLHHWPVRKLMALGGLVVTALAGGWGALTMTERLSDEAHQRTVEAAQATPAYVQAERDSALATALYAQSLTERVPESLGPLTTEQRSLDLERRRQALRAERDEAREHLADLTPEAPTLDVKAAARGWGAMLTVLLGLSVFGFRGRSETLADQPNQNEPQPRPLTASELGKLGAQRKRERREQAEQARLARNAYQREYRARQKGQGSQALWNDELFGTLPN